MGSFTGGIRPGVFKGYRMSVRDRLFVRSLYDADLTFGGSTGIDADVLEMFLLQVAILWMITL